MAEDREKKVEEIEFEETYLTRSQLIWRAFRKHKLGMFGLWVLVVMYLIAIFADFLAPHNPYEQSLVHSFAPPTPIHTKYKGERVGPYVLPSVSFIDKFTSERKFYEMLFPSRIVYDGKTYEISDRKAVTPGKEIEFDPEKGEDVYFEFTISKFIKLKTKDGKDIEKFFQKEYTKRLLIGYNDSLLKKGTIEIDLNTPTAKAAVLSNFGNFSKELRSSVGNEKNISDLRLVEKLEKIDLKWSSVLVKEISVDELKERVVEGARKWMEGITKSVLNGADPKELEKLAGEVEKIVVSSFERSDLEGYLDDLMNGNEIAIDRIAAVSGGLIKLGVDVKGRLREVYPKIMDMVSAGNSKSVVRDFLREVFYSMGRDAARNIVLGYEKARDKNKYLENVLKTLSDGVGALIDTCDKKLESMVKSMTYEEAIAEGVIRGCFANLMKSELLGEVEYMPGEIGVVASLLIETGIMNDPSFGRKLEDLRRVEKLKAEYAKLRGVLLKASRPGYRPSKEEMEKMKSSLEDFLKVAKEAKFSTPEAMSSLRSVVRNVESALRYLKRGRSVYYYYKRILTDLEKLVSAKEILESIVTETVSVGKIGFSYPTIGKIALKKYNLDTIASINLAGKGVDDYDYKIYKVKFFIKSWEGKLLWLFPLRVHLFGVENPDNNPYVKLFIMGADQFGRDVWSRIAFASRVSLSIGLIGMSITFGLALIFGGISGYYGGIVDEIMMRIAEIIMSIPGFYLLILLRALLPMDIPSTQIYILLVFILSFIGWAGTSRVIRGMVLSIRQREFVEAAVAIGLPDSRILMKHVLPNTTSFLIVAATLRIPGYILGEAGLSYLGLGIREPDASWGLMLAQAQDVYVLQHAPWLLIPGAFIFFTVLSFNFVGDALRDALDPRSLG